MRHVVLNARAFEPSRWPSRIRIPPKFGLLRFSTASQRKTTMELEGEAEVLELYELHYSDLILLSSAPSADESTDLSNVERLETIRRRVMETLGPAGPGLLSVTGFPNASLLRRKLLPLARKLALLDHDDRKRLLKEHNLGSDVPLKNPDRNVSSFAMQLKYKQALEFSVGKLNLEPNHLDCSTVENVKDDGFENLAETFVELGYCMMDLGLRLAQICDKAIGGHELERSLLESGTAKGRLIHYHSTLDNFIVRENGRRKGSARKQANRRKNQEHSVRSEQRKLEDFHLDGNGNEVVSCGNHAKLWQQWHYDYGIFTVLTAPMFLVPYCSSESFTAGQLPISCDQECPYPSEHSCLQIFDRKMSKLLTVKTSPESFIIQVGESADILSKGKLRSTLHCVSKPRNLGNVSRETFVVFLQPAWSKTFSISDYTIKHRTLGDENGTFSEENGQYDLNDFAQEILKIVPPLSSRLKDRMTFAEFSRITTKQYYGGSGLQSNK